jgi:Rrf2 family protein
MAVVSTKGAYGLTAMIILAKEEKLIQIKEIASKGDIPQNYLEQILVSLKRDGLVESIRGANGGYKLLKDKKDITVYEILSSLDCCVSFTDSKSYNTLLEPFWNDIQTKMQKMFSLSLDELEKFLDEQNKGYMYFI